MEFAGVDKAARSKTGVENAGVDNSAPCCRDGLCRSGQCGTMWQGWTMREWSAVTKVVYKITSLGYDSLYIIVLLNTCTG